MYHFVPQRTHDRPSIIMALQRDEPSVLSVLVVEDNALIAEAICEDLQDHGCAVIGPASRAEDALALASARSLDGALLDINLGGEMSFDVADHLARKNVPFIFLSGYNDHDKLPPRLRSAPLLTK